MKKLLYLAVAAIAALSSCSNDDVIVNENENENQKVEAPVFTATIEGEAETRTTLVQNTTTGKLTKVNWEESGEEVKMVFVNSDYSVISLPVYKVTPSTVDASTATLTIKDGETYNEAADLLFFAIYPASLMTDQMKYIFPATQEYKGDGKIGFAPMLGVKESQSVPQTLNFKNACALLAITIPYTEMTSVRSITVSSDLQMNGQMDLDTGGFFKFNSPSNPGSGENQVTLDCYSLNNANVAIPEGGSKTFYVSIVPRDDVEQAPYLKYLQIDVTDGNITKTMRTKTFEGTKTSGIEIVNNKIYPITFEENQTPRLKIKVTSNDITTLQKIKVVTDQIISGTTSKELVYDVPEAQQSPAADGTVYSINIPAKTYEYYKIYLSADGTTYKEAMASKGTVGAISGPLNIDYEKNAVQLWADGPYFATMNVGETTVGGNTVKYAWGATSADGAANANTDGTAKDYDDEHDTAYNIWGSAWRMPTQEEFEKMSSNCSLGYIQGGTYTVTGKEGYSSAKVSFPGEYVGQSVTAYYWTSTVKNPNGTVYYGSFNYNGSKQVTEFDYTCGSKPKNSNNNDLKYFVRAVLQ